MARFYPLRMEKSLNSYCKFLQQNADDLLKYYCKVFEIKQALGILPVGIRGLSGLNGFSMARKPLLLLGDCEQTWIDNNSEMLDAKVKEYALGVCYFGSSKRCANLGQKGKNRHLFEQVTDC